MAEGRASGRPGLSGLPAGDTRRAVDPPPGQDLRFSYHSEIDGTDQPYAVYVPSRYDDGLQWPVVINLHGTSSGRSPELVGQTYANHYTADENAAPLWAAERHGAILVTPHGRGITEFRGIGENDVFCVLAAVRRRYNVDLDRISITGLSMGGTGSTEIALHHPGIFAAAAPVGAAYSFPWLAANGRHLPFWCIGGEDDFNFHTGGKLAAECMERLGYPARLDVRKGRGHADFLPEYYDRIVGWLVRHRVVRHPRRYSFSAALPMYGQAYWTAIDAIEQPGTIGTIRAGITGPNRHTLTTENLSGIAVLPDAELVDVTGAIQVHVDGRLSFEGAVTTEEEVLLSKEAGRWRAEIAPRRQRSLTDYRTNPVAVAPRTLTMEGVDAPLANWISDAMRAATGAGVALYNRRHYRGLPIPRGAVDEVDLLQCSRPFEQYLVVADMAGRDLIEVIEDNVRDPGDGLEYLVQPSGLRYAFSWDRPRGRRITDSDVDPGRIYKVVLEGQSLERAGRQAAMFLAGLRKTLDCRVTDIPLRAALYAHAVRTGKIEPAAERRVRVE